MYTFENDKVRLRATERDDLDNYVRWFNDSEAQRTLVVYGPQSREAEQAWLDGAMIGSGGDYIFAIEAIEGAEAVHIGSCAAHKPDWRNASCEIGIAIGDKSYWGRGYGPAAFALLLEFCFGELNLHRVWLRVYDFNQRGIHAYQKLGFKEEGRLREAFYREGAYHDVIFMGILKREWQASVRTEVLGMSGFTPSPHWGRGLG